ncbi:MAG: PAS domain S-box protein, partial [Thermoplasmata archaeon]|nr:PAS domain S-box protein [Thermoplasmata archaeon]
MRKSDGTNRKPKEGEEKNYKTIFKEAPISLWEVDFSGIQGYLDMIKEKEGIEDFREYFQLFPGAINKIVNLVEIVNVNKAAIKLIKAKSKKELKRNIRNVFTDKARKDFIKGLIAINKGETRYAEETTLKTLKEKNIHVMMRIIAIPDDEKTLSNVLIAITDITELKRAEEEISQILEGSPIPAFVIDSEHILTHWNKACEKLTGKSTRDLIGTKDEWSAFYPKERPVMAELIVDGTLECEIREIYGKSCRKSYLEGAYEAEGIFPKLGNKWLSFTAAPLKDAKGNIIGAIETLQDITDRINTQEALKEEYNLLNSLMEHIPDSIYFKDTAGHFTRINKAKAERMKLADPSEAIGKTDYDFYDKEHADRASADEKEIIKSRVPLINKEEKLRINGEIFRWVSATKVPIINRKGEVTGIVGISRDITESKRVKEKISQIVQGNSIATFVIDNKHILTHWNIACEKLT